MPLIKLVEVFIIILNFNIEDFWENNKYNTYESYNNKNNIPKTNTYFYKLKRSVYFLL